MKDRLQILEELVKSQEPKDSGFLSDLGDTLTLASKVGTHDFDKAYAGMDAKKESFQSKKKQHLMLQYELVNSRMESERIAAETKRKQGREDFRDALSRDKVQETRRHNTAMENKKSSSKPSAVEMKRMMKADDDIEKADALEVNLDRLAALGKNISTGGVTSHIPYMDTPLAQSIMGGGKQEGYDEFDKIAADIVVQMTSRFGSRGGARIAELINKSKPNRKMSPEAIQTVVKNLKAAVQAEKAHAQKILGGDPDPETDSGSVPKSPAAKNKADSSVDDEEAELMADIASLKGKLNG